MMPPQQRPSTKPPRHILSTPAPASDTPGISWQRRGCLLSLGLFLLIAGMLALLRSVGGLPARVAAPTAASVGAAAGSAPLPSSTASSAPLAPLAPAAARVTAHTPSALIPTMWRVTRRVPHDSSCFTQGLAWRGRVLYEGSGMTGQSQLRRVSLAGGAYTTLASVALPSEMFGEGVTLVPGEAEEVEGGPAPTVLQLTWQNRRVFTYDADTLAPRSQPLPFSSTLNEGWGLTHNGKGTLVMSDGSANLHFWSADAAAYAAAGAMVEAHAPVAVRDALPSLEAQLPPGAAPAGEGWQPLLDARAPSTVTTTRPDIFGPGFARGSPLGRLNELEWAHGWVLSNVWYDRHVAIIDPGSGEALWYLDLSPLYADNAGRDCLNGLAYTMLVDAAAGEGEARAAAADRPWGGRLWVTGKYWNFLYEIELGGLVPADTLRGKRARKQGAGR